MTTRVLLLTLGLLLTGCATGRLIGTLPTVPDATQAATVVIARPYTFVGSARTPTITIDGLDTYEMGPGEHVVIAVEPGDRVIGMKMWDLTTVRATVKIHAEAGRSYYFVCCIAGLGTPMTNMVEVTEADGREHVANTTAVGYSVTTKD